MGVYIKGMEMPKACVYRENGQFITCPLYDIDGYCGALNTEASHKENGKLSDCPLVEIPPHGRLIDADALYERAKMRSERFNGCFNDLDNVINALYIETFPTVLEAEEGE